MADAFGRALVFTLQWEGGYANHPADKGGATNRGITQGTYDAFRRSRGQPSRSVKLLEAGELRDIYCGRYWKVVRGDDLPERLAVLIFDTAVLHGVSYARRTLQKVLSVKADGVLGPATLAALKVAVFDSVLSGFAQRRDDVYEYLVRRTPSQSAFYKGWERRLDALEDHLGIPRTRD